MKSLQDKQKHSRTLLYVYYVFLCIIFGTARCALCPLYALAGTAASTDVRATYEEHFELNLIQRGNFDGVFTYDSTSDSESGTFTAQSEDEWDELEARLITGLYAASSSIDISSCGISWTSADLKTLYDTYESIVNNHPDLFYVSGVYDVKSSYSAENKIIVGIITPTYDINDTAELTAAKAAYENKISEAFSWIKDGATNTQKVKAIHDFLLANCTYDHDASNAEDKTNYWYAFTSYGALVKGSPVCEGYTLAFMDLMQRLNITVQYVSQDNPLGSNYPGHSWNRICLYSNWYNLDITWDDSWTDAALSRVDDVSTVIPSTRYFLKSDSWWKTNHKNYDSTGDVSGTSATTTTYDTNDYTLYFTYSSSTYYYSDYGNTKANALGIYTGPSSDPLIVTVAIPTQRDGLTYNNTEQTGLIPGSGYTLTGTLSATNAGSYTAYATLLNTDNKTWADGSTGKKKITWSIAKAGNTITCKTTITRTAKVSKSQSFSLGAKSTAGTLSYKVISGSTYVKVSSKGKVTIAKNYTGIAKLKVSSSTKNYTRATATVTIKLKPAKMVIKKATNVKTRAIKISWTKQNGADKYQVQIATNTKFTKGKKTYTTKSSATSKKTGKLKKGKTYYIRIRAYDSKTKSWGSWSATKKVKIRK